MLYTFLCGVSSEVSSALHEAFETDRFEMSGATMSGSPTVTAFDHQRSKLDNEHDDENDYGVKTPGLEPLRGTGSNVQTAPAGRPSRQVDLG